MSIVEYYNVWIKTLMKKDGVYIGSSKYCFSSFSGPVLFYFFIILKKKTSIDSKKPIKVFFFFKISLCIHFYHDHAKTIKMNEHKEFGIRAPRCTL